MTESVHIYLAMFQMKALQNKIEQTEVVYITYHNGIYWHYIFK